MATSNLLWILSVDVPRLDISYEWGSAALVLCVWLVSCSIICSRFLHGEHVLELNPFRGWKSSHLVCVLCLIRLFIFWWAFGVLPPLDYTNNVAVNTNEQMFVQAPALRAWGILWELPGSVVSLSCLLGTPRVFSTAAASPGIPSARERGRPLHSIEST